MYAESTKIAKAMTRLDAKAEKMNPKSTIRIKRMIKTYNSLMQKLEKSLRKVMPLSSKDADIEKMQMDIIKWAEERHRSKRGRQIQRAFPKRHGVTV